LLAEIEIICALIAISLPILAVCGVFRLRQIVGPQRLMDGESILTLFAILLLSSCIAFLSATALVRVVHLKSDRSLDVLNGLVYVILLLVALMLTSRMRPMGLRQLGLTTRQFFRAIPRALLTAIAILPLVYAASLLVQVVIEALHRAMPEAHPMLQQLGADQHSIWFAIVIFEAVVLVPLAEELLFRGLLQTIIVYLLAGRRQPATAARWIGVLITAAIFAAVHLEIAFFLPLFVLAIGLGYLYERTGNLWASAMMHGLFNALQIVLYLNVVTK
jgi:membrane protease YdiL (CAAX protease family)